MKNLIILAALILTSLPVVASAAPVDLASRNFFIPESKDGRGADGAAKWALPSISVRDTTVTAVLAHTGKGLVRGVCSSDTAGTAGVVAIYDSIATAGATAAAGGTGTFIATVLAKSTHISAATDTGKANCSFFERPLPYSAGLVWLNSAASMRSSLIFDKLDQ